MPLVKKINKEWMPSEKPDIAIGETMDVSDAQSLVDAGLVVYCDDKGNELVYPGGMQYKFPVVLKSTEEAKRFVEYFLAKGKEKAYGITDEVEERVAKLAETLKPEEVKADVPVKLTPEELKAKRIAVLAKAREARKNKKES